MSGGLPVQAWLLIAILLIWSPTHFWALALVREAGAPRADTRPDTGAGREPGGLVLPAGRRAATRRQIFVFSFLLAFLSMLPFLLAYMNVIYGGLALVLGGLYVFHAVLLLMAPVQQRRRAAWGMYEYSLLYLGLLITAMILDRLIVP